MDQFCRRGLYTARIASVPAILDLDVTAIDPAEPLKRVKKCPDASLTFPIGPRVGRHQHPDPPELLRLCDAWPRRRAAEKRDEIAPPDHSITSSAAVRISCG